EQAVCLGCKPDADLEPGFLKTRRYISVGRNLPMKKQTLLEVAAALFVAAADSTGTLPRAKEILRDALDDGAVTAPTTRTIIANCAADYSEDASRIVFAALAASLERQIQGVDPWTS